MFFGSFIKPCSIFAKILLGKDMLKPLTGTSSVPECFAKQFFFALV